MIVDCPTCGSRYQDEYRSTICPHYTFPANDGKNNFAHHPEAVLIPKSGQTTPLMDLVDKIASYPPSATIDITFEEKKILKMLIDMVPGADTSGDVWKLEDEPTT